MILESRDALVVPHVQEGCHILIHPKPVVDLVVFDVCVTVKKQEHIEEFFIRGRKKNAYFLYITQSYYSKSLNIRNKCNYFVFFEIRLRGIRKILARDRWLSDDRSV